jgi:hypothetical protein
MQLHVVRVIVIMMCDLYTYIHQLAEYGLTIVCVCVFSFACDDLLRVMIEREMRYYALSALLLGCSNLLIMTAMHYLFGWKVGKSFIEWTAILTLLLAPLLVLFIVLVAIVSFTRAKTRWDVLDAVCAILIAGVACCAMPAKLLAIIMALGNPTIGP